MTGLTSGVNGDLHSMCSVKPTGHFSKTRVLFAVHRLSFIPEISANDFSSSNAKLRGVAFAEGIFANGRAMLTAVRPANWWTFSGR